MPLEFKAGKRYRRPTHPGAVVARQLENLGISAYAAAAALGVSRTAIGNIVNQNAAVSLEMALRLGKFFGNGPELWLDMQTDYDLWQAKRNLADQLARIKPAKRPR